MDIAVPRGGAQDRAAAQMAGWWNRDGCRAPMAWSGDANGRLHERHAVAARSRRTRRRGTSSASGRRRARCWPTTGGSSRFGEGPRALRSGDLALVDVGDPDVLAYLRRAGDETALVVVRFGLRGGEIELPPCHRAVEGRAVEPRPGHAHGRVARRRCDPSRRSSCSPRHLRSTDESRRPRSRPTQPGSPGRSRPTSPGASPPPPTRSREPRPRTAGDRRSGTPSPAGRARSPMAARATSPATTTTATRRTSG